MTEEKRCVSGNDNSHITFTESLTVTQSGAGLFNNVLAQCLTLRNIRISEPSTDGSVVNKLVSLQCQCHEKCQRFFFFKINKIFTFTASSSFPHKVAAEEFVDKTTKQQQWFNMKLCKQIWNDMQMTCKFTKNDKNYRFLLFQYWYWNLERYTSRNFF